MFPCPAIERKAFEVQSGGAEQGGEGREQAEESEWFILGMNGNKKRRKKSHTGLLLFPPSHHPTLQYSWSSCHKQCMQEGGQNTLFHTFMSTVLEVSSPNSRRRLGIHHYISPVVHICGDAWFWTETRTHKTKEKIPMDEHTAGRQVSTSSLTSSLLILSSSPFFLLEEQIPEVLHLLLASQQLPVCVQHTSPIIILDACLQHQLCLSTHVRGTLLHNCQ